MSISALYTFATATALSVILSAAAVQAQESVELLDLTGATVRPLAASDAPAHVFVFMRADCPISNRYAPELNRLQRDFARQGVKFWLVYPDPEASATSIDGHLKQYALQIPALRDPQHRLVALTEASITPEAALFDAGGRLVYRGRIDNRYVAFGRARPAPTRADLELAIEATLAGKPVELARTDAVGCFIADLK